MFLQILQISQENTCVGVFMEISIESLLKKVAGIEPEGLQLYWKKTPTVVFQWNSCHCLWIKTSPVYCFHKGMANITSHGKVSFNYNLLFHYSRCNSTIIRNLSLCNSANFRKRQKPLLCYVVNWNLVSTLAKLPHSWSPSVQLFFCKPRTTEHRQVVHFSILSEFTNQDLFVEIRTMPYLRI